MKNINREKLVIIKLRQNQSTLCFIEPHAPNASY